MRRDQAKPESLHHRLCSESGDIGGCETAPDEEALETGNVIWRCARRSGKRHRGRIFKSS